MALSFVEVNPTSGGQTTYSNINLQFVSTADIFVTVKKADGEVITLATNQYTVTTSPSLTVTITDSAVHTAIATNDTIRIFRDTSVSAPARIFSNGSVLKSSDLNANHNQILFAQQENDELGIGDALQKDASGAFWDATSLNIRNVADAVESKDAVTLGQVNAALVSAGSVPSVPQSYSTASGTLSSGAFADGNTTFAMTPPPTSEFEQTFIVEIDGVIQRPNNDYTVVTGTTTGTLTLIGADVTSNNIVVTNFGLSRQVFDFPTTGTATTSTTTPLTLQGHSSQSVCIFLVEQNGGDDIFCVMNDYVRIDGRGTSSPLIVKQNVDGNTNLMELRNAADQVAHRFRDPTENTGTDEIFYEIIDNNTVNAGGDVLFKLNRSLVNDSNNSERGNIMEVDGNTGSGSQKVFKLNQNGRVHINVTDDTIATQADSTPALIVEFSGSSDQDPAPYIRCLANDGTVRHQLGSGESRLGGGDDVNHIVKIGSPDPTGDNAYPLRSGLAPSTDDVSGTNNSKPYWRFTHAGSKAAGNRRGQLELTAMSTTSTALAIRLYRAGEATSPLEVGFDGRVKINNGSRTKNAEDVLRKDEVAKAAGITLCTHNTNDTPNNLVSGSIQIVSTPTTTTDDTSTYTITSNNSQIAVSQSSGVITVAAGTFLATYSVDAECGGNGTCRMDYELQLLKNGVVVAQSVRKDHLIPAGGSTYGLAVASRTTLSLQYSELITATGNTTYQLRGVTKQLDTGVSSNSTGNSFVMATRQKSLLIHNLGES